MTSESSALVQLQENAADRVALTIERDIVGSVPFMGYVLDVGNSLAIFHYIEGYHLDGYCITAIRDVATIRRGKFERFVHNVLKKEREWDAIGLDIDVDLTSWGSVMKSLRAAEKLVAIGGERQWNEFLFAGKIVRVNRKSVTLREIDPCGRWGETRPVPFASIDIVFFDDEWLNVLAKHAK